MLNQKLIDKLILWHGGDNNRTYKIEQCGNSKLRVWIFKNDIFASLDITPENNELDWDELLIADARRQLEEKTSELRRIVG